MFNALRVGFERAGDRGDLEPGSVAFRGFDGNAETKQLAYTRFYCGEDTHPRYTELDRGDNFNSHLPKLRRYRAMLPTFKRLNVPDEPLTIDQIKEILQAGQPRQVDAEG